MDVIGIICEYNPFHNGHLYHINEIKKMYPDSLIILVLNGYFLERGETSILNKEDKTKLALKYGVDIVIELPFIYGTQSADIFADTAIQLLHSLNVSKIVFGSESNNIELLTKIANTEFTDDYDKLVKKYLDEGINYPTALAKALNIDFTFNPNDLLGISYIKSILKHNYSIEPVTIKRTNSYHDKESNNPVISASNIREKLLNNIDITDYVPESLPIKKVNYDLLFTLLKYKILTDDSLENYLDVDEGIENRLQDLITKATSYQDFVNLVKTKRYTYNKINRMLIHILLGLKKQDNTHNIEYIKVLGFNQAGQKYLNTLNVNTTIDKKSLTYKYEILASMLYDILTSDNTINYEIKNKPIIVD